MDEMPTHEGGLAFPVLLTMNDTVARVQGSSPRRCSSPSNAFAQLQASQIGALRGAQCNSLDRLAIAAFVRWQVRGTKGASRETSFIIVALHEKDLVSAGIHREP